MIINRSNYHFKSLTKIRRKTVRQPLFARMSLENLKETINSPPTKTNTVRPVSAPHGSDEKMKSPPELYVNSSPGNNVETQMPSSTKSDESP